MPTIIGSKSRVVDTGALIIDEWAGNVASLNDTLSIATVVVQEPTNEPWLTLDYDEWLCVTAGTIELEYFEEKEEEKGQTEKKKVLVVHEGETAMVSKGERFRPVFPIGNKTSYIAVCLPAFSPERCLREEEEKEKLGPEKTSAVSKRLQELHHNNSSTRINVNRNIEPTHKNNNIVINNDESEILYHMCQKSRWDDAVQQGMAYFPPTFVADGRFTHATAVPSRLIITANHFYTTSIGDWICLQLSRSALWKLGIDTVLEEAKPVGETATNREWDGQWICPHIYGGIPTHIDGVVTNTFPMRRSDDGSFVSIVGLTDS